MFFLVCVELFHFTRFRKKGIIIATFIKGKGIVMNYKYALHILAMIGIATLGGCAGMRGGNTNATYETPGVDYVENLDVYAAPHKDSFLNQLAMNYRSYAVYNARTSGYPDIGELFAQKAIGAFSGETPFPESLDNWNVNSENEKFEIYNSYNDLMEILKSDALQVQPKLAAESQAKFDCWLSATASGQSATATECKNRFLATMQALRDCMDGKVSAQPVTNNPDTSVVAATLPTASEQYYPETHNLSAMSGSTRAREGLVIVNNVNIPSNLVQVVPVPAAAPTSSTVVQSQPQPLIFNQNIYGVDAGAGNYSDEEWEQEPQNYNDDRFDDLDKKYVSRDEFLSAMKSPSDPKELIVNVNNELPEIDNDYVSRDEFLKAMKSTTPGDLVVNVNHELPEMANDYVSRDEFIGIMLAMRDELAAINDRLNSMERTPVANNEKTVIKVQQIPLEPKQHVMEEIFEIRFDFDKSTIKPEYEEIIRKLASTTQANKNIKVSVVGHTDTVGSSNYNYAMGGRRAEAVQKMLIKYGIPANQIIAVSAGKEDLKVQTPNNTPNAENRRVRVVKEVHFTEQPKNVAPIVVEEYKESDECEDCDEM